ncbi:MAG TPA: GNAT family N-acetyltransferase [Bacteroidales bacterium]|nr:peptidoglycan bridge formation glycyltransferase FemA/FemB family protein [Bacteroidales bacterium]HNR40751.1 GNAT family N-acetyltransferase [Bacteroidales bacterium]
MKKVLRYRRITDFDLVVKYLRGNFSSPTHWPEWNLLVSKYYNTIFYYFGLFENDELAGICPVHETKSGFTRKLQSGQFHYIPNGGWLTKKNYLLDIMQIPVPGNAVFECFALPGLDDFGAEYKKVIRKFHTLVVYLRKNEEDIWSGSVNSKRRNMIRKAHKEGILVKTDPGRINDFFSVYTETNRLNKLHGLPSGFFYELIENSSDIKFLPFVAYDNENPCAVLGLIHDKDYAFYWLGGTKAGSENHGQGELLQWEAIKYSRSAGCKYYDLCYIEKERLPNIYEFKRGFSDIEVEVPYFVKKPMLFRVINKIRKK